jgi:Flp pilus assembly protein TadG
MRQLRDFSGRRRPLPLLRLARDTAGTTAVETALLLPAFIAMILGGIVVGSLGLAVSSLNLAVEDAARCASVKTTVCTSNTAITDYAKSKYSGPAISPVFTYSTAGCGHTVSATGTYSLNVIPQLMNIPLTAHSCYP